MLKRIIGFFKKPESTTVSAPKVQVTELPTTPQDTPMTTSKTDPAQTSGQTKPTPSAKTPGSTQKPRLKNLQILKKATSAKTKKK